MPKEKMISYLESKNLLSLATVDEKGNPSVRSVEYVNRGADIYILSAGDTAKVKHIKNNNTIAFTVDEDLADWSQIQGVQMSGQAYIIEEIPEKKLAFDMLKQKFPQFEEMSLEINSVCIIKIKPTRGVFIDNPAGQGLRHTVDYS